MHFAPISSNYFRILFWKITAVCWLLSCCCLLVAIVLLCVGLLIVPATRKDTQATDLLKIKLTVLPSPAISQRVNKSKRWPREHQDPHAPQGSASLLPKLSMTSKVSARTSCAWVGSRVRFRSSEDVTLLEFTSPVDREYTRRCQKFHWI